MIQIAAVKDQLNSVPQLRIFFELAADILAAHGG